MTPEGKVKDGIKKAFKALGCWYYCPVQNGMGVVGIPDFIACAPVKITPEMVGKTFGLFMGVEAKAPGKEKNTTPNQVRRLTEISEAKGLAIVTSNADDIKQAIGAARVFGNVDPWYIPSLSKET